MFQTKISGFDLLAAGIVLLVALLLLVLPLVGSENGQTLTVTTPDGAWEYDLSINREWILVSRGITLTVVIENGSAYVRHSDCPDGVCMSGRPISKSGETLLCAPAGVTLRVKGGGADVDFVAG